MSRSPANAATPAPEVNLPCLLLNGDQTDAAGVALHPHAVVSRAHCHVQATEPDGHGRRLGGQCAAEVLEAGTATGEPGVPQRAVGGPDEHVQPAGAHAAADGDALSTPPTRSHADHPVPLA